MAGLGVWLTIVVCVVAGDLLRPWLPASAIAGALGLVWGLLCLGACARLGALRGRPSGGCVAARGFAGWGMPWLGAALLLAVVRGVVAPDGVVPPWIEARRGVPTGLRTFVVQRASTPTGRCELLVAAAPSAPDAPAAADADAVLLSAPAHLCPRAAGDRVAVRVQDLQLRVDPALPGDPAPASRAQSQGAVAVAFADAVWLVAPATGWRAGLSGGVARLREAAWAASRGDDAAAFVVASCLGLRQALHPARRTELRAAGLGHLVAVSGLHVGIAGWLVARLLLRVGTLVHGSPWLGVVASWLFVGAYVVLTGSPPSAVRAGAMAMAAGLGDALGRPAHGVVLLAATSAVMLLARPMWAFDPGFQLSVVAMAVLVRAEPGDSVVRTTWRVTWAVVPVGLLHFGSVGAYAVVTNLIAVPIVTLWTMPVGLVGVLLVPWLGAAALVPAAWGARTVLDLAGLAAQWPPVSTTVLGGVAGASLCLSVGLWARAAGRARPTDAWTRVLSGALVPPLAAVATLACIALPHGAQPDTPGMQWAAVGTPQRFAVVVAAQAPGTACMVDSVLPGARWPGVLEGLGVHQVVGVAPGTRGTLQAPHMLALTGALREAGLLVAAPGPCVAPPRRAVAGALRHCRRVAGRGRATAVLDTQGRVRCFVRGRFQDPLSGPIADPAVD